MNAESPSCGTLPSLTIVIPHYNHGHLIGDQLRSIFAQTAQPKKIIIIDDASTDDSVSIIEKLIACHPNVEFVRKAVNSGGIAVGNEALGRIDTEYVCFLAADDITLPRFIEASLTLLARHPQAAFCSAISRIQYRDREYELPKRPAYPSLSPAYLSPAEIVSALLRIESWFMGNTTIYRQTVLLEAGGFDPKLRGYADGFLCCALALRHGACFVPEPLGINRQSDTSYSAMSGRNPDMLVETLIYVHTKMTTDYRDVFPPELVARSNARSLFRVLCAWLDRLEESARTVIGATHLSRLGLLPILTYSIKIMRLLMFAALRFRDIPIVAFSKFQRKRPN